jgi:UDP-N-acetylglucosamine 2-epimerase
MRIAVVQGTRPEIIKNYSVVKGIASTGAPFEVLHTNQHVVGEMCGHVYRDLGYEPHRTFPGDYRLGSVIDWLQSVFRRDRITHVVVNGDTAAALAGAVAAMYLDVDVTHVEAGLRSGDPYMLEERNRIMIDSIATLLFAYTQFEADYLRCSKEMRGRVFVEGNTTIDILHDFASRIDSGSVGVRRYVYVTMHRKEFTDSADRMKLVFSALARIAESDCRVVFPVHPRTRDAIRRHGIEAALLGGVELMEPVSVFESLSLQKHAAAVLTDSGCIQEEAYMLKVPCVTIRENTERFLTVQNGANVVTGFTASRIRSAVWQALRTEERGWPDIFGHPGVGKRIARLILGQSADGQPFGQEKMAASGEARPTADYSLLEN